MQVLIQSGVLTEINDGEANPDDIVIYIVGESIPKHAGKITPDARRVKSKWGTGLFWEHELLEVPESYGNKIRIYREIPAVEAERIFLEFVKSQDGWEEFAEKFDLSDV